MIERIRVWFLPVIWHSTEPVTDQAEQHAIDTARFSPNDNR